MPAPVSPRLSHGCTHAAWLTQVEAETQLRRTRALAKLNASFDSLLVVTRQTAGCACANHSRTQQQQPRVLEQGQTPGPISVAKSRLCSLKRKTPFSLPSETPSVTPSVTSRPPAHGYNLCPLPSCAHALPSLATYIYHLLRHHGQTTLPCPRTPHSCPPIHFSSTWTSLKGAFTTHETTFHPAGGPLTCGVCGARLTTLIAYFMHTFNVHMTGRWNCRRPGCTFMAPTQREGKRHEDACALVSVKLGEIKKTGK